MSTLHHPLIYGLRGPLLVLGMVILTVVALVKITRTVLRQGAKHG